MINFDPTISLGNIVTGVPTLLFLVKIYGDWRLIRNRIDLMWIDFCKEHGISDPNAKLS